ncbi:MAG: hypothetical protein EA352_06810 [Gemmatimonadales bacterium]|nr:MAG: hypothetical protein EA352_06810 [Gemmatimonadales bacterium]
MPDQVRHAPAAAGRSLPVLFFPALLLLGVLALSAPVHGQSADELLGQALERQSSQLDGIAGLEMDSRQMGIPSTSRFEVVEDEAGIRHLRFVEMEAMGNIMGGEMEGMGSAGLMDVDLEAFSGTAELLGEAEFGGRTAHQMAVRGGIDEWIPGEELDEDVRFEDGEGTIYLDVETLDFLGMRWEGTVTHEGETHETWLTYEMRDWQETDGFRHAGSIVLETDMARFVLSDEDRAEIRMQLEMIDGGLPPGLPMEGEMGEIIRGIMDQSDNLMRMLEEGIMTVEVEIEAVRVQR